MSELPEKVIVSNGCHKCPFGIVNTYFQVWCTRLGHYTDESLKQMEGRHPQCPLLTHSIKVVKNDQ